MFWIDQETRFDLRPKTGPQLHSDAESIPDDAPSPEEGTSWIVCRQCRKRLTKSSHGLSIDGSHLHTFANPSGIVFEIACYYPVSGIALVGMRSNDFAWFSGHSWQIGICSGCRTHLGWLFSGPQARLFYALIIDRIIEEESHG
jgi:hypothetical protein